VRYELIQHISLDAPFPPLDQGEGDIVPSRLLNTKGEYHEAVTEPVSAHNKIPLCIFNVAFDLSLTNEYLCFASYLT